MVTLRTYTISLGRTTAASRARMPSALRVFRMSSPMVSVETTRYSRTRLPGMGTATVLFTSPPVTRASFRLSEPMSTPNIVFAIRSTSIRAVPPAREKGKGEKSLAEFRFPQKAE